jgi:hypothetical protein
MQLRFFPDDIVLDAEVDSIWGRNTLPVKGSVLISRREFQVTGISADEITIRHLASLHDGRVVRPGGEETVITPGMGLLLRANDRYHFLSEWADVYVMAENTEAPVVPEVVVAAVEEEPSLEEEEEVDDIGDFICADEEVDAYELSYAASHITRKMIPKLTIQSIDSLDPLIRKEYAVDERAEEALVEDLTFLKPRVPILEKMIARRAAERHELELKSEHIKCLEHEQIDLEKKFKEGNTFDILPLPKRKDPTQVSTPAKKRQITPSVV